MMNDGESILFTGQTGTKYEFYARPLNTAPEPVGGVYVIARRTDEGKAEAALQLLFIGQSDDIAESAEQFRAEQDLSEDPDVLFCMHLEDANQEQRQAICEDLRNRYLPREEI